MIGLNMRFTATRGGFPNQHSHQLEGWELENLPDLCARDDTVLLIVEDTKKGSLIAYGVVGIDDGDMFTIYAARSVVAGIGAAAVKGLFGASKIAGKPMRVHAESVRTYARILGATDALETLDSDGVKMGVFNGQQ